MLFVWRGVGIAVPVVFFLVGWIVSFWFKDTRLGNSTYLGWVCFYAAISCLLLGVAALGMGKPKVQEDGTISPKKKHDFFFVPVIFWAPILGALSAWMLFGSGGSKEDIVLSKRPQASDTIRVLHFYNPTADTLYYVFSDETGYFEKEKLKPFGSIERPAPLQSYLLAGLRIDGRSSVAFPDTKDYDTTKYVKMKEGDTYINQRIITPVSKTKDDYEDAWVLLDRNYNMAVIDITDLYGSVIQKNKVEGTDWTKKVRSTHPGNELVEIILNPLKAGVKPRVCPPNTLLPVSRLENEPVYFLLTYPADMDLSNDYIKKEINRLIM